MLKSLPALILGSFLFLLTPDASCQQPLPSTFLWKISGKGLQKPSYLYGTMHLQDKRLFNFPDSLYSSLENTEGFALELDIREMIDSVFARGIKEKENELLAKEVSINDKYLDRSNSELLRKFGLQADKLTKKDLKKIRDYKLNQIVQKGEMPTIVDGYLYGLAQRLGKMITGIEDVNDQLNIPDELGADLTPEQVFMPEAFMRQYLERMISIYVKKDLQQVEAYISGKIDNNIRDLVLIKRNVKMARRIDSLMQHRSTFFAVGVAHLPGDSGLIRLLQEDGFTVEPVFSNTAISAEKYAAGLMKLPWKKDENQLYNIEMPGTPSQFNMMGEAMTMKAFFDLPTMTMYLSGYTAGQIKNYDDVVKVFQSIAASMGSFRKKIVPKNISTNDMTGGEAVMEIPEGFYRIRLLQKKNTMYMLMIGSPKKNHLTNVDADRFFQSFEVRDVLPGNGWENFSMNNEGISMMLPGKPKVNETINRSAEGSNWNFKTYDFLDNEKGLYFLIQARELKGGYYLDGDTTYLSFFKNELLGRSCTIDQIDTTSFRGWPAFRMNIFMPAQNAKYRNFTIVRGNRVYGLLVGGTATADLSDADKLFESVKLEDYSMDPYRPITHDGFSTSAPAAFIQMPPDDPEQTSANKIHYFSHDEKHAVSYEVFKDLFPKYYWTKSDSAYLENKSKTYLETDDSLLANRTTYNGNLKGREILIRKQNNNILRKVRYFINGDTLYTIIAYIPEQYINYPECIKFYDDFRVSDEKLPVIYQSKTVELLEALKTTDTTELLSVLDQFQYIEFEKQDLPHLHKALQADYLKLDETYYRSVTDYIINSIVGLDNGATVQFISGNYPGLKTKREESGYKMLNLLARIKTSESYSLLKKYIVSDLPSKGENQLEYALSDSLQLTATLFPAVLSQLKDSVFADGLIPVITTLIDSNLLSIEELIPFKNILLAHAGKKIAIIKENEDLWYRYTNWVELIRRLNDKESNEVLRAYLSIASLHVKYSTVMALVKNNQDVPFSEMEKLAADIDYRAYFYTELKKLDKQKLFPVKYATQEKIAQSEIYGMASDENEATVTLIGERTTEFMGVKQKFYLYKVSFEYEDGESENYLGIAGGYAPGQKEITSYPEAMGIYWNEELAKGEIDRQFKSYLESTAAYLKEQKELAQKN